MFDFITDPIDNALGVVGDLLEGEVPTRRQVAKLLADGISIVAISEATGIAVDVIENLSRDDD